AMQWAYAQKDCRNPEYQQQLLLSHPELAGTYSNIERFTRSQYLLHGTTGDQGGSGTTGANPVPSVITIPVVVHVLYNNGAQNISDAQIRSQIDALTNDYRGLNADRKNIPYYFADLAADAGIQFSLAKIDPQGRATSGIVRHWTSVLSFTVDDRMKSSALGGDDAWDANSYLNIWVCNTINGLMGYSSLPGGPADKDGVVISYSVFGIINTSSPFNKGRTAVHEVGHWLNLRHIWGDTNCGDDAVDDTPQQQAASRGCPSGEHMSCGNTAHGDMYMNFMDFTDDACMYMFTPGQRDRMRALFAPGGPRHALLSSAALTGTPNGLAPAAELFHMPDGISVALYPNPASSTINIKTDNTVDCSGKTICVYNRVGQLLYSSRLSQDEHIDISRWNNGVYFVSITGLGVKAMTKFIKQ
ncbi:MAG: T9SS type A sorting domain-containing protein, partial [Bacteroidetes bacterium]|nr:T9SS type A sorting domain-containing protein [Bacteroidota bacterium]